MFEIENEFMAELNLNSLLIGLSLVWGCKCNRDSNCKNGSDSLINSIMQLNGNYFFELISRVIKWRVKRFKSF